MSARQGDDGEELAYAGMQAKSHHELRTGLERSHGRLERSHEYFGGV